MAKVLHVLTKGVQPGNDITQVQITCDVAAKNDAGLELNVELYPQLILRSGGVLKTPAVLNQELMADVKAYLADAYGISGAWAAEILYGGVTTAV